MTPLKNIGHKIVEWAEMAGLLLIAILTIIAMGQEVWLMFLKFKVSLIDLLLLFIYLEVLAMVGLYFKSGRLPIRVPRYIVIVALARYMMIDMKNLDTTRMLAVSLAMVAIAIAVLIIRFGQSKYPSQ